MNQIAAPDKPLLILNASAGSGKTYRLVLEYLTLLFHPNAGAAKYRHLVAMTFTNKAAFEMKERILKALHNISCYQAGDEDTLALMNAIGKSLSISTDDLPEKAGIVLSEILHGYEDFLISTIDKFNLRLIRSFNRDLNIPQEFEVVMNESDILEKVIDAILAKVGTPEHPELTALISNYTKKNLEEESNWNFRKQLIDFCSILSKERYLELVEILLQQEYSEEDLKDVIREQNLLLAQLTEQANEVSSLFNALNLADEQLPQKSNTSKPIVKLANLTTWPDKILTPTVINTYNDGKYDAVFSTELLHAIGNIIDYFDQNNERYFALAYYRDTFYNLALLQYVAREMEEVRANEHFIRISEFNRLISSLVRNQHAPYIYERLGNRLQHFMLDEFQDTSRMQWLNLIPLVEESISKNNKNLIVGDAKQSIYRFNNGLADQFVALPKIYNPEGNASLQRQSDYFEQMGKLEQMDDNYRSGQKIVAFNNQIFEASKAIIPIASRDFYNAVHQHAKKKFDGYVEVKSIEAKHSAIEVYPEIISIIEKCLKDGFKPGDICILNEKNGQGNNIAQYLTDHNYKVVSADSLLIDSDARIRLMISYLKIRNRTSNQREFMKFADLYLRLHSAQPELDYLALFDIDASGRRKFNAKRFILTHFKSESQFYVPYTNLYDLIQKFYDLSHWSETQDIYLHHFADICFNFQLGRKVDLNSFLEYYESNRKKLAIQSPKTNDAIQIMTVHKSKGLQFPVVILPNVDYNTSAKGDYLIAGDNQVFYRKPKKESPIKAIRAFTIHELNQCFMDKLNLLYVAMTRPVHRLYVFNVYEKSNMGKSFHELLVSSYPLAQIDSLVHLQLGEEEVVNLKVENDVFYQPEEFGDRLWYPELVVRQGFENDHTMLGNAFHTVMATCNSMVDVDENIAQLLDNSALLPAQITPLKAMVERILTDENYQNWVTNAEQTFNETWILSPDASLLRPDKIFEMSDHIIVIDFKTGQEASNHKSQLGAYKKILSEMKSKPVEGLIYYAQTGNWVPC